MWDSNELGREILEEFDACQARYSIWIWLAQEERATILRERENAALRDRRAKARALNPNRVREQKRIARQKEREKERLSRPVVGPTRAQIAEWRAPVSQPRRECPTCEQLVEWRDGCPRPVLHACVRASKRAA